MDIARSINNVPIRLTGERWLHIIENHDDLAGHYDDVLATVEEPDYIIRLFEDPMGKEITRNKHLRQLMQAVPHLLQAPDKRMLIDYDQEADVLYISFKRPQKATDTELLDNGILLRYRGKKLVGVTVLDASKRSD